MERASVDVVSKRGGRSDKPGRGVTPKVSGRRKPGEGKRAPGHYQTETKSRQAKEKMRKIEDLAYAIDSGRVKIMKADEMSAHMRRKYAAGLGDNWKGKRKVRG